MAKNRARERLPFWDGAPGDAGSGDAGSGDAGSGDPAYRGMPWVGPASDWLNRPLRPRG